MKPDTFAPLKARWAALAPRERLGMTLAAWVLGLGGLWWWGLSPALTTLRSADVQRVALEQQWQSLRALQAEARNLQAQPRMASSDALRALEASLKQRLPGTAQLNVIGDRATVTLKASPADAVAQWLAQARANARALPIEARLTRSAATAGAGATWDGSIVLRLP